jgi:L-alanine-DL-glutamate epimerase-like enolase superfamily enzyme
MWKLPIHPHSSMTGLNQAVSIHFLAAIDNGGYFEADLSVANKFRDELGSEPWKIGKDGCVRPLDRPGIGVEIDETFLEDHPVIEGTGLCVGDSTKSPPAPAVVLRCARDDRGGGG